MLKLIPLLLTALLLWTPPAWATITVGSAVTAKADAAATTIAAPAITLTAGQGVEVCTKWEGNFTLTSVASDKSDTVVLQTAQQFSTLEPSARCAHVISVVGGSTVFTATLSGAATYRRIHVYPITYNGTLSLDVQSAASTESVTLTPASAAVTTTGTDEVCFGFQADYTTQAFSNEKIGNPLVAADGQSTQSDTDLWYKIFTAMQTTATSQLTRTTQTGANWVQRLACFKTAGGGGTPPVTGTTRYVSPSGSDSNSCTASATITTPKRTFASAVACMSPGDTLYIRAGTWTEMLDLRNAAGTAGLPKTFAGYPGESPCLTAKTGQGGFGLFLYGPTSAYIVLRNMRLDGSCDGTTDANLTESNYWTIGNSGGTAPHDILIDGVEVAHWKGNGLLLIQNATNITIKNSIFRDMVTNYSGTQCTFGGGNTGQGRWYGIYASSTTNLLIENSQIYNNVGGGLQIYPGPNVNTVIRNNSIHDNNMCSNAVFGGILFQNLITNGLIHNNLVYNNGSDARSGNSPGIQINDSAIGSKVYNNTVYGNKNAGIDITWAGTAKPTNTVVTNNHVVGNLTSQISDIGTGTTQTTNRTTGTITDCTVSTSNFTQKAGSSCIGQGTAISGFPYNGAAPDQGRYETFGFTSATITGNTMLVTLGQNISANNPILPATGMTGWTVNNGRTVTAAIRQASSDSIVQLTISGAACLDADTWTVTYTPGNVTDSAGVAAGSVGQPLTAFTTQPVTNINCSGGAAPTAVLGQANHQFLEARYATGTTNVTALSAIGATNTNLHSGIPFALALQVDCTIADCLPLGSRLYYSLTPLATGTPGAFTLLTNTVGADQIAFYGTTADSTVLNGATPATCLSGALTPTAGTTNQTYDAVPIFDLGLNACTVNRYVLQLGASAVLGDIYLFKLYNQTGVALDAYTPAGGAKLTVVPTDPISAPTGPHETGTASNTIIELIWPPFDYPNLAGYHIYQCSTTPCTSANWTLAGTNTPSRSMSTHSSITTFRTNVSAAGTYYYVVTAFDTGGQESTPSSEVAITRTGQVSRTVR